MAYDEEKNKHIPIQIYLDQEAFKPTEAPKRKTPTNTVQYSQKLIGGVTPKANWNNYYMK